MVVGIPTQDCDVAVIGGGPGGYLAAIRLAQQKKRVLLIDGRPTLGGLCLNEGCIPSKALIHAANLVTEVAEAEAFGLTFGRPKLNLSKLIGWKDGIVEKLTGGVRSLVKRAGGELLQGRARFIDTTQLEVETADGLLRVSFEQAVIAAGTIPLELPNFPLDGKRVVGSREALSPSDLPQRLLVIGAGYIGLELGSVYAKLGCKVQIIDVLPDLLPSLDRDVVRVLARRLKKLGVDLLLGHRAERLDGQCVYVTNNQGQSRQLSADRTIVCIGRKPNSAALDLEKAGVETDPRGFIVVDEQLRSSADHIYAIGDITPGPPLAHRAYRQAEVAAAAICGEAVGYDNVAIPAVIYTDPEIAIVGLSEQEARARNIDVQVGTFSLRASGRAMTLGATEGLVKVTLERETERLLGVQIVAPSASEMIGEATLALEMAAFADDLSQTIHAHPTLSEAVQEATLNALGKGAHA
ncbi:MAG: dihydrolipoyl dehydrogenase [Deltaproteobacteria bacterium]|nr:dihydrolipoyl dehydrogenase [Deltaproteobacteria bacterium]